MPNPCRCALIYADGSFVLPTPAAKPRYVFNQSLPRITDVVARCPECGWIGTVYDCEPDVDGDGGLGCPACFGQGRNVLVITEGDGDLTSPSASPVQGV